MRAILWDKPKCEVYVDLADANQSGEIELGVSAEIIAKSVKVWWFRIKDTNGVINCYSNYVIDEENDKITILTGEENNYEISGNTFKASEGSSVSIDTNAIAPTFDSETGYNAGQYVMNDGKLYKVTENISSGSEWDETKVEEVDITSLISNLSYEIPLIYDADNDSMTCEKTLAELGQDLFDSNFSLKDGVFPHVCLISTSIEAGTKIEYRVPASVISLPVDGVLEKVMIQWFEAGSTPMTNEIGIDAQGVVTEDTFIKALVVDEG